MIDFYTLLNAFINTHEATTTKTKDRKNRIMNNVKQLYNEYSDTYKKNYDSEKLNEGDENFFLTLTSLKYLARKKNQSGQKKKLREKYKDHYGLK